MSYDPTRLKDLIADKLRHSYTGLLLRELAESIDENDYECNRDRISAALSRMMQSGYVEKSGGFNNQPARWRITPQGRAYYSDLNQESSNETPTTNHQTEQQVCENPVSMADTTVALAMDHTTMETLVLGAESGHTDIELARRDKDTSRAECERPSEHQQSTKITTLVFDTERTLDRALYGLVKLILDVANQTLEPVAIEKKSEATRLLETLANSELINTRHRATLFRIYNAVEQMEDA